MNQSVIFLGVPSKRSDGLYWVEGLRTGKWHYPGFGDADEFEITPATLKELASNFRSGVKGIELPVDGPSRGGDAHSENEEHDCGWIKNVKLAQDGQHLYFGFDITNPKVKEQVDEGSLKYCSSEIDFKWLDPVDNKHKAVLEGMGLTNRPYIKGMQPIQKTAINLSEFSVDLADGEHEAHEEAHHDDDEAHGDGGSKNGGGNPNHGPDGRFASGSGDITKSGGNPQQMSWEAVPGTSEPVIPGIHSANYADKKEYTNAVLKELEGDEGREVFRAIGVHPSAYEVGPGYWEGVSNPCVQMQFRGASEDQLKEVAAVLGTVLHQDGVGWHSFEPASSLEGSNILSLKFAEDLKPEHIQIFHEMIGSDHVYLVAGKNELRLLNHSSMTHAELSRIALESTNSAKLKATETKSLAGEFGFLGKEDYDKVIRPGTSGTQRENVRGNETSTLGRPDFQKSLRNFYDGIQKTRIDFAKRKGWGDPDREAKLSEGRNGKEGTNRTHPVNPNGLYVLEGSDTIGVSDPSFLISGAAGGLGNMSETQNEQILELGEMRAKLADAEKNNAQYQARLAELESMNRETAKELRMSQVKARLSAMVTQRDKNGRLTTKITPAVANRVIKLAEVLLDNGASFIKLSEKVKLDDKATGDGTDKLDVINELLDVLDNVPDSISMNDDSAQLAEGDRRGDDDDEDALDKAAGAKMKENPKLSYKQAVSAADRERRGGA